MFRRVLNSFISPLLFLAVTASARPATPAELTHRDNALLASETQTPTKTLPVKQPKRGGTLTVATEWDISTLNPFQKTFSVDEYVRDVMYDALLRVDLKDNVQPHLAESWEVSKDGRIYTFKLRRGVKFHDGREMTAEDVQWSINFIVNPKNAAYGRQRILMVDRAEAADRYTVRVHLNQSHAGFLAALTQIKAGIVTQKGALEGGPAKSTLFLRAQVLSGLWSGSRNKRSSLSDSAITGDNTRRWWTGWCSVRYSTIVCGSPLSARVIWI